MCVIVRVCLCLQVFNINECLCVTLNKYILCYVTLLVSGSYVLVVYTSHARDRLPADITM